MEWPDKQVKEIMKMFKEENTPDKDRYIFHGGEMYYIDLKGNVTLLEDE